MQSNESLELNDEKLTDEELSKIKLWQHILVHTNLVKELKSIKT
jgi:hypothetical protein